MTTVTSADGTAIAYDRTGADPRGRDRSGSEPLILVDGAFCSRSFGPMPALARQLAGRFTVYTYDRRGRAASGDTPPYAVEREIEDIEALARAAGAPVHLFGASSGAALALRAAAALPGRVRSVAAYEPPIVAVSGQRPVAPPDYRRRVDDMIAEGRNADAVKFFMRTLVGVPAFAVTMMRLMPAWSKLAAAAPTLRYDIAALGDTLRGRGLPEEFAKALAGIDVPVLVADGGKSPAWLHTGAQAVADAVRQARRITVPGQTHQFKAGALAPVLTDFFTEVA